MSLRLEGKVAVVTGTGGAGMGRAVALRFAQEGAVVVGCDINTAGAEETEESVRRAGGVMYSFHPADMQDEDSVKALMAYAVDKAGGIDILYNNVVWSKYQYALEQTREDLEFSVMGCIAPGWMSAKYAVPTMAARGGGSIINVASICAHGPGTGGLDNANFLFSYGVGKAGVVRMTELLAIDLAVYGIRVNCISPGVTLPVAKKFAGDEGSPTYRAFLDCMLLKRLGQADDVAKAALYFASDDSSYVTGQHLCVDGGWSVSGTRGWPSPEGVRLMNANTSLTPPIPEIYRTASV